VKQTFADGDTVNPPFRMRKEASPILTKKDRSEPLSRSTLGEKDSLDERGATQENKLAKGTESGSKKNSEGLTCD
jgi:hypothetical protein